MNSKWYISTLIIILTLLGGIASEHQVSVPNQEIVLQFANDDVTSLDTQQTITMVKQQLLTAGVENIQVQKQYNGQLKITYYSDSPVEQIKELLSKDSAIDVGYVSHNRNEKPSEDKKVTYNLDVYEIQQSDDLTESNGKLALEPNTDNDRLINPNVFISVEDINIKEYNSIVSVAYKFYTNVAIAIDNRSQKIPEVRAGPTFYRIGNFS